MLNEGSEQVLLLPTPKKARPFGRVLGVGAAGS